MALQAFIEANLHKKTPNNFPVSHPTRGFDVITKDQFGLWKEWGYSEESWDVVEEPKGVKKGRRGRRPKVSAEPEE